MDRICLCVSKFKLLTFMYISMNLPGWHRARARSRSRLHVCGVNGQHAQKSWLSVLLLAAWLLAGWVHESCWMCVACTAGLQAGIHCATPQGT